MSQQTQLRICEVCESTFIGVAEVCSDQCAKDWVDKYIDLSENKKRDKKASTGKQNP